MTADYIDEIDEIEFHNSFPINYAAFYRIVVLIALRSGIFFRFS